MAVNYITVEPALNDREHDLRERCKKLEAENKDYRAILGKMVNAHVSLCVCSVCELLEKHRTNTAPSENEFPQSHHTECHSSSCDGRCHETYKDR